MLIKIPTSGGYKLESTVFIAKKNNDKLALLLPGFLENKDYLNIISIGELLVKQSYNTASFNPTGTWGSSGTIADYSLGQYLKDIKNIISYLDNKNKQPYKKIVLIGHSLGAMMSILYGVKLARLQAIIAIMPPQKQNMLKKEKIKEWKKQKSMYFFRNLPTNSTKEKKYNIPFSFIEDSYQYDLLKVIPKLTKPILFVGGKNDDLISPKHIKTIYKACRSKKKLKILNNVSHHYRNSKKELDKVNKEIISFIKTS